MTNCRRVQGATVQPARRGMHERGAGRTDGRTDERAIPPHFLRRPIRTPAAAPAHLFSTLPSLFPSSLFLPSPPSRARPCALPSLGFSNHFQSPSITAAIITVASGVLGTATHNHFVYAFTPSTFSTIKSKTTTSPLAQ